MTLIYLQEWAAVLAMRCEYKMFNSKDYIRIDIHMDDQQ